MPGGSPRRWGISVVAVNRGGAAAIRACQALARSPRPRTFAIPVGPARP